MAVAAATLPLRPAAVALSRFPRDRDDRALSPVSRDNAGVSSGDILLIGPAASVQFQIPIRFRVIRIDPKPTYQGWLWLEGYELDDSDLATGRRCVFVQAGGLEHAPPGHAAKPAASAPERCGPAPQLRGFAANYDHFGEAPARPNVPPGTSNRENRTRATKSRRLAIQGSAPETVDRPDQRPKHLVLLKTEDLAATLREHIALRDLTDPREPTPCPAGPHYPAEPARQDCSPCRSPRATSRHAGLTACPTARTDSGHTSRMSPNANGEPQVTQRERALIRRPRP